MCGISGAVGAGWRESQVHSIVRAQRHRGPDAQDVYFDPLAPCGLGHNRLSILDLSEAGKQPMSHANGHLHLVFNGEIYNYLELREQLSGYPFRTATDTEVILAAYERWGADCLDKFLGMFTIAIWNERDRTLFLARDRFGVKPLYYSHLPEGGLLFASEVQALLAAGVPPEPDSIAWSTYFVYGLHDHDERSFWRGIHALAPGHTLTWKAGEVRIRCWYDLATRVDAAYDERPLAVVEEEYKALLLDSIRLRFRSDVPVGINISGGLDSSTLLGLVHAMEGPDSRVKTFTYRTSDPNYDEWPWVERMLKQTQHPSFTHMLDWKEIPELAVSVMAHEAAPYGGFPTLAYARLFEIARREGVIVLLDGQGIDEQFAGYEYYEGLVGKSADEVPRAARGPVQASKNASTRPDCLTDAFRALAEPLDAPRPFPDALRNRQYQDARYTKIPRALRFNDRISMRVSTELREPFLDHRLFELALRQPPERKIVNGVRKWMVRKITKDLLPIDVVEAPKRPVQTPQREWIAGPLAEWSEAQVDLALTEFGGEWLNAAAVREAWKDYRAGGLDNSFFVWQWISLGLTLESQLSGVRK
jgi:asparagine synthase (glutamine-hydrolysing)